MSLGAYRAARSFLLVLAIACTAHAQGKPSDQRARELFLKGDTAYAEARYDDALAAFQESYDLSGRPQLLFNIANALERLGKLPEAIDALEKYLASGKVKERDKAVIETRLTNLKKRLDEQKKAEEKAREDEQKKQREADAQKKPPPPPPPPPPEEKPPILPWALVGGGGVLVVTGAVFGVVTLNARSDAKSGCTDAPAGHLCDDGARSALDREKTFGILADVSVLAGLVAGGVGAYLLLGPKAEVHASARGIDVVGHF